MPPISKLLGVNRTQFELDFVDIYPDQDLPLFLDPFFVSKRFDSFSQKSSASIRSFFRLLINLLHNNQLAEAKSIFIHLHEPSETCLGLSKNGTQGRGIGCGNAEDIFNSLLQSKAVQTGLVEDLEDCRIFVDGIDKDKISDMTTNLIRRELIDYTAQQCRLHNIPLINAPTGFYWDRHRKEWLNDYSHRLIINNKLILLVPKAICSFRMDYTPAQYHQHFVLNYLQNEHLQMGSNLVQTRTRKNGRVDRFVTKKDLEVISKPPRNNHDAGNMKESGEGK